MASSTRLSELCERIVDCPHSTPVWTDYGAIVLRSQNIRDGRLDLSAPSYTDDAHFQARTRRAVPTEGDLVITREAPMGEVCIIPSGLQCCLGQRMVLLRPNRAKVDSRYLLFALQSNSVRHEIFVNEGTGSTVSNLRIPLLEALPIPTPALPEQRAIAHILGTLDDKIELNRRMNETLEAMARALFQSWFVDFDPVRAKAEGRPTGLPDSIAALFPDSFEESEFGKVPRGWRVEKLGSVADVNWGDTSITKQSYVPDGYPAYSASGCDGLMEDFMFDRVGVVVSAIGANCGQTWLASGKWSCIKNTLRFWATDARLSTEYLFYLTASPDSWPKRGSAQPFISQGDARNLDILVPDRLLAKEFGRIVSSLHVSASIVNEQSKSLASIRNILLPKLISGEIRLDQKEESV